MTTEKDTVKKRSIKEVADDMFGLTFEREIAAVLGSVSRGDLNKLRQSKQGKKVAEKIEKIQEKYDK